VMRHEASVLGLDPVSGTKLAAGAVAALHGAGSVQSSAPA
jgi:hypothetical protein